MEPVTADFNATATSATDFAWTLISTRQTILPRHLEAPGPDPAQIELIFRAAATAPDHGCIRPWRFVQVPVEKRELLAAVFRASLETRDPHASLQQLELAGDKAYRSPFLCLAVARLGPAEPPIEPLERMVSVGAAVQNLLLCAHAMGFGTSLTGGQALQEAPLRELFALEEGEHAVCFINIGTATQRKTAVPRPPTTSFVGSL